MKGFRQSFRVDGQRSKSCVTSIQRGFACQMRGIFAVGMTGTYLLVKVDHAPARISPPSALPGDGR